MADDQLVLCSLCGQDYQTWYRVRASGRAFLLCPECDAVWLPDEDRHQWPTHDLPDLFPPHQRHQAWDLIERCDQAGSTRDTL